MKIMIEKLIEIDPSFFKGGYLNASIRLLSWLENAADGSDNLKEMSSTFLSKMLKSDTYRYSCLKKLKELSIIETTENYSPGKTSKKYRISNDWLEPSKRSKRTIEEIKLEEDSKKSIWIDEEDLFEKKVIEEKIEYMKPEEEYKMDLNHLTDEDFFNAPPGPKGWDLLNGIEPDEQMFITPKIVEEEEEEVSDKIITFKYKGYKEVTETFKNDEFEIIKEVKESAEDTTEQTFVNDCVKRGFSEEKAWYYFNKLRNRI